MASPAWTVAFIVKATPLVINHLGQFPAATISFNLAPGASLGEAVKAIRAAGTEMGMPASVQTRFQGAALAFQASLDNTLLLILAAIVTMYIVLGVLYESYIHPVTILSTLPSAGVGALLALSEKYQPQDARVYAAMMDRLLVRRNANMAERIRVRLKEGNAFVAVGALHLPGDTGLLRLLSTAGYRVTRVY